MGDLMCWPLPDGWVIYWTLWVQLIGFVIWPVVALVAASLFAGPIRRLVERANKVTAGDFSLETLSAKVDAIDDEPEARAPIVENTPQMDEALPPPETLTVNQEKLEPGWNAIVEALQSGFQSIEQQRVADLPRLARTYFRQRKYVLSFNQLVITGWISFELRDVLKSLYELRENAVSGRLSADDAALFNRNAKKSAGSIKNAIAYRVRTGPTLPARA